MRITIETATGTTPIKNNNIFEITINVEDIKKISKMLYDNQPSIMILLSDGEHHRLAYPERDYETLINVIGSVKIADGKGRNYATREEMFGK